MRGGIVQHIEQFEKFGGERRILPATGARVFESPPALFVIVELRYDALNELLLARQIRDSGIRAGWGLVVHDNRKNSTGKCARQAWLRNFPIDKAIAAC